MDEIRLAGIECDSVTDGPGIRLVLFLQGCPHQCCGCHNPDTWDYSGGRGYSFTDIHRLIQAYYYSAGVTFSGGEPFLQARALARLGKQIKEAGYTIVTYSGYRFEELVAGRSTQDGWGELLQVTDILIDGPYVEARKSVSLPFRGSDNQRLISVPQTLDSGGIPVILKL